MRGDMRSLIVAVVIAGIVEGFVATVRERWRVDRVIAETRAALDDRADEIAAQRDRWIASEGVEA